MVRYDPTLEGKKMKLHHFTNMTDLCGQKINDMIETSRKY